MIGITFEFMGDIVEVRIINSLCYFRNSRYGGIFSPIEGLKLNRSGCLKEHPDLKDREDWKEQSIKRFKDKMKQYKTEEEQVEYVITDLKKYGYKPIATQKSGFRIKKIKNGGTN
jgi:hypothetical protein